jgi:hypothetical protein
MAVSENKSNQRQAVGAGRRFLCIFAGYWRAPTDAKRSMFVTA